MRARANDMPRPSNDPSAVLAGRYALERELGRGATAIVHLARDLKHGRPVAIKLLRKEMSASIGADRFHREIRIAARLNHPHILPLHDSGEADGRLFYAMPYIEGETLAARLEREGQLPLPEAVRITREVADGLAYAHRSGIVHRDVKPSNILLSDGHAVIADFGVARALEAAGGATITRAGTTVGSPAYMSPEQASGESHLDGRSDIYSLGCVLYEMLIGEPPFHGPTTHAVIARHLTEPAPSLRAVRPAVPEALEAAVHRALAKNPADRFTGARDLAEALGRAEGVRARGLFGRWMRGGWRAAAVVVLLTVAGVIAWLASGLGPTSGSRSEATRLFVTPFRSPAVGGAEAAEAEVLRRTFLTAMGWITDLPVLDGAAVAGVEAVASPPRVLEIPAVARRNGADYVITGDVVRAAEGPRLTVKLYDAAGRTVARAVGGSAEGEATEAAGRLALEVVSALAEEQGVDVGPGGRLGRATRSPLAVRYVLEGRRRLSDRDVDGAVTSFRRAIDADSLFGDAWFWLSMAETWGPRWDYEVALGTVERGLERSAGMTRQRVELLRAQRHYAYRRADSAVAAFQRIVVDNPEMAEAWFGLGESLYHFGGYTGQGRAEAVAPFERALAADSGLSLAHSHLAELALWDGDAERMLAHMARLPAGGQGSIYRSLHVLAFGTAAERTRLRDSLSSAADYGTLSIIVVFLAHEDRLRPMADTVAGILLEPGRTAQERRRGADYRLVFRAAQGRWEEGVRAWQDAAGGLEFDAWLVAALLAGYPAEAHAEPMLERARDSFRDGLRVDFGQPVEDPNRQSFRALVHRTFLSGDSAEVEPLLTLLRAEDSGASEVDPLPSALEAVLEARLALLAADTAAAIARLERSVARVAEPYLANYPLVSMAAQRMALAEIYAARGDVRSAEAWLGSFWETSAVEDLLYRPRAEEIRRGLSEPRGSR